MAVCPRAPEAQQPAVPARSNSQLQCNLDGTDLENTKWKNFGS
jgi:hypothetical protein